MNRLIKEFDDWLSGVIKNQSPFWAGVLLNQRESLLSAFIKLDGRIGYMQSWLITTVVKEEFITIRTEKHPVEYHKETGNAIVFAIKVPDDLEEQD